MRFLAIFQKAVHHFSLFFLGFRKDVVRESPPGGGDTRKQPAVPVPVRGFPLRPEPSQLSVPSGSFPVTFTAESDE